MREPLAVQDAGAGEAAAADPVAEALRRADVAAVWAAVSELAPQQREALLLREFGGLSYEELGVALGVSVPAVESLLFRARSRLRQRLEPVTAALGGAGWLSTLQDALARLGSVKAGSLPLAAKAATATLGLAAAGGAAVAVEHDLAQPHRHRPAPPAVTIGAAVSAPAPTGPAVSPRGVFHAPPAAPATRSRTGGGRRGADGREAGDRGGTGSEHGSSIAGPTADRSGHDGVREPGSGSDGRASTHDAQAATGDGSHESGGEDGAGGSDGGATTATTTTTTTTIATTTADGSSGSGPGGGDGQPGPDSGSSGGGDG